MKLTYITNLRIPSQKANGIQVMQNCEALSASRLVIPWRIKNKFERGIKIWDYYSIDKKFPIKRLPCIDFFQIGKGNLLFLLQAASFYFSVAVWSLFHRLGVIYTRDIFIGLVLFFKGKKFLELHNFPSSSIGKMIYKLLLPRFKGVIVISENLRKEVLKLTPKANVLVAADGVKKELFNLKISQKEARKKLDIPDGPIFLYSGSLYKWKGIDLLIEAFKEVQDKAKLYVIGGSVEDEDVKRVQKIGTNSVVFTGHVEHKDVPLYLKAADYFVLPNLSGEKISKLYTSPLKLFEYMLAKRPIIASDLPSIREVLGPENSLLFEADSVSDLSKTLKKVLNMDTSELADKAYLDGSKFTWDRRADNILSFIDERCKKS